MRIYLPRQMMDQTRIPRPILLDESPRSAERKLEKEAGKSHEIGVASSLQVD